MPDFKFWSEDTSARLCKARDYPEVTRRVITEMYRQVGDLVFDQNGLAKTGVLVRHLVMPGHLEEAKDISAAGPAQVDAHWAVPGSADHLVQSQLLPDFEMPPRAVQT